MKNEEPGKRGILPVRYQAAPLDFLSPGQVEQIHQASLHILEHSGVRMVCPRAWEALAGFGARIDRTAGTVYFSPSSIESALQSAPRSFSLCARDPARDLLLDGKHGYLTLDGCGLQVIDRFTGLVRDSGRKDLAEATHVADYLEQVAFLWPVLSARDCPAKVQPLFELAVQLSHSTKHVQAMTAVNGPAARGSIELAAVAAGGLRSLRDRPVISNFQCSISPLAYDPEGLEAALIFAAAGVPVGFMTMQIGCSTAPATLAGSLAQGNAEILAGIAFLQACFPGSPTFYGSCATVMELRTGGVACGGPEDFLLQALAAQMARYYRLPSNIGTFATGAKVPNWYAGVENAVSGAASIFAGADMMCGAGLLDGARIFAFEQLLLDCEIFEIIRRIAAGIAVNTENLALDTIHRVGSRSHFMTEPHTLAHLREIWQPHLLERGSYGRSGLEGSNEAVEAARDKASWILEHHRPEPLEPGAVAEMEKIIETYLHEGE